MRCPKVTHQRYHSSLYHWSFRKHLQEVRLVTPTAGRFPVNLRNPGFQDCTPAFLTNHGWIASRSSKIFPKIGGSSHESFLWVSSPQLFQWTTCPHKNPIEITRVNSPTKTITVGSEPPSCPATIDDHMGNPWYCQSPWKFLFVAGEIMWHHVKSCDLGQNFPVFSPSTKSQTSFCTTKKWEKHHFSVSILGTPMV